MKTQPIPRLRHTPALPALAFVLAALVSVAVAQTAAPTTNATKSTDTSAPVQMSAFEVEDIRTHEYRATNSMSASRLPMALSEVPFNIAIITEDFMLDTASFGGDTGTDFSGGANREAVSWNASVNGSPVPLWCGNFIFAPSIDPGLGSGDSVTP